MKTISVSSMRSTGLAPEFDRVQTIEIDDEPLGQGGFGAVYRARSINGRPPAVPQVVKILLDAVPGAAAHGFETIQELQRRLGARHADDRQRGSSLLVRHPALLGVPQVSFQGLLEGRPVVGYSANDLDAAGLQSLGRVLDDETTLAQLQGLPLHIRIRLAFQLVDAFDLLTQLQYIHADLKAEAVFVDLRRGRCALIDFDSGAVARDAADTPSTFGTKQDWLAPEIVRQLDQGANPGRLVKVTVYSDMWSVNVGLHYLLFGCHPLFFLSELSERSVRSYLQRFRWPHVDASFPYFVQEYAPAYAAYRQCLAALPAEMIQRLAFTINDGYGDTARRTRYGQWKVVLAGAGRPAIVAFAADRTHLTDARPVRFMWRVTGAARLRLSGVGEVTGRGFADVAVRKDTVFTLTLEPESGPPITQSVAITVSRVAPVITSFTAAQGLLTDTPVAQLRWEVSKDAFAVGIDPIGAVGHTGVRDVPQHRDTDYVLTASSYFGATAQACIRVEVSKRPPVIRQFSVTPIAARPGLPIEVTWAVEGGAEVRVTALGRRGPNGTATVCLDRSARLAIEATSCFGVTVTRHVDVRVMTPATLTPPAARTRVPCAPVAPRERRVAPVTRGPAATRLGPRPV